MAHPAVTHATANDSSAAPLVVTVGKRQRGQMYWSIGLVVAALLGLVIFMPYAAGYGTVRRTIGQWLAFAWADATWQHGALAAPVAAFLVWRRRRYLATLPVKASYVGLALSMASLLLFWIGYRGNFYYLGYASIQMLVAGAVLWLFGWRYFIAVSFAWLILGFSWPYLFLEDTVAFKLRFLMVSMTHDLLNAVGVPTLQDGTRLISAAAPGVEEGARFSMNVDGPCSGLRSLFALMMVSALFGYFRQRTWWRRTLLFALSVPLAVVANTIRIIILTFATMAFGERFALGNGEEYTSNFHLLTGLFVFVISLGGLLLAEYLLNRFIKKERPLNIMGD